MSQKLDQRKIIEALKSVSTLDGNSDIIASNCVSGVLIKDGHTSFTIEIDPKDKDKADELRIAAEKVVLALDGVLSATAMITAHQSEPTMAQVSQKRSSNSPQGNSAASSSEPHQPATHVIAVASGKPGWQVNHLHKLALALPPE